MTVGRKSAVALLVLLAVSLSLPAIAYGVGLWNIDGRPVPENPSEYAPADLDAAWQRCGDRAPVSVVPLNPWGYTAKFFSGAARLEGSGQLAAWQIVRAHNHKHLPPGMRWWHLSGAALTIWVTRHWSGEQIAATLVRDNLCAVTPNKSLERTRER
jgi:hypothetical protein